MELKDYLNVVPKPQCVVQENRIKKPKYPVIDMHTHLGKLVLGDCYQELYSMDEYIEKLRAIGVVHSVNLDGVWGKEMDDMLEYISPYEKEVTTYCWIDVTRIDDADFSEWVVKHLNDAYKKGCRGIKMWKVISLNQKDQSGKYIQTDDKRLKIVYKTAASLHMPILIHIADPTAFFESVDESNERYEELSLNPDWQFGKKGQLGFQELLNMQENMIAENPETTFIVAHVGSYAENLQYVDDCLDKYPNMYIDIAARIAELGRVPYSARAFFIKHQDRILFGTDETPIDFEQYEICFRFLETKDEYFPYWPKGELPGQGRWYIYGIGLPDEVLKKIYYKNALQFLQKKEINIENIVKCTPCQGHFKKK